MVACVAARILSLLNVIRNSPTRFSARNLISVAWLARALSRRVQSRDLVQHLDFVIREVAFIGRKRLAALGGISPAGAKGEVQLAQTAARC